MDRVEELRAGLVGLPPNMLLQRLGVLEGMPVVDDRPASTESASGSSPAAKIRLIRAQSRTGPSSFCAGGAQTPS